MLPLQILMQMGWERMFNLLPDFISYLSNIPEGNEILSVKHGAAVTRSSVRCLVIIEDVRDLRKNDKQQI